MSIHDIFHPDNRWRIWDRFGNPMGEVAVIRAWLTDRAVPHFTAALRFGREARAQIERCRREIGIVRDLHYGRDSPMVFLRAPLP